MCGHTHSHHSLPALLILLFCNSNLPLLQEVCVCCGNDFISSRKINNKCDSMPSELVVLHYRYVKQRQIMTDFLSLGLQTKHLFWITNKKAVIQGLTALTSSIQVSTQVIETSALHTACKTHIFYFTENIEVSS